MVDTRVANRELQATTEGNKATRTTAMTIQDDLGNLRAARNVWSETQMVLETNHFRIQS